MNPNHIEATFLCEIIRPLTEKMNKGGKPWGYFLAAVGENTDGADLVSVSVSENDLDGIRKLAVGTRLFVRGRIYLFRFMKDGQRRTNLNCAAEIVCPLVSRVRARVMADDGEAPLNDWRLAADFERVEA